MTTHERSGTIQNRRVIHGWAMYDWANSAFATSVLAALLGPYLDKVVVPPEGITITVFGYAFEHVSATSLWGYAIGATALLLLLTTPVLGAIADTSGRKKTMMRFFCYLGSVATSLLYFSGPGDVTYTLVLFMVANYSFVAGNVFYDAFLPLIARPEEQDDISGKGYAYGYLGGGLLFLLHLLLIQFHDFFGIQDAAFATRLAFASVGFWWGGFALITFKRLEERQTPASLSSLKTMVTGFRRIYSTARQVSSLRHLLWFLLAFMVYNDGIQTVISMATIYGSDELGLDYSSLMLSLLLVQLLGVPASRAFGRAGRRYGTKPVLIFSLVVWSAIVVYAYFMQSAVEFFILGGFVGFVLGGSQALSRSLYSKIIPIEAPAEFFGFFSVFEKFSAIWGPLVFAVIRQSTGSSRLSILSLIIFFVLGFIMLLFFKPEKAKADILSLRFQE